MTMTVEGIEGPTSRELPVPLPPLRLDPGAWCLEPDASLSATVVLGDRTLRLEARDDRARIDGCVAQQATIAGRPYRVLGYLSA